eukprot:TRINITY_DN14851_c0_g1::TRINITY_DN14851_c0_g1_i1::g.16196::m.16196 TRINITY_DN14851_c0_g1::TRINITY_DN14851_c0_g1_i1::g.16196  ORF type:complete len:193 (-),score=-5.13,sp/F2Z461/HERC6_MOUSE/30.32/1e-10,RCC1/PF00415.13/7.7e-07,RCC1/PF00415.13/0.044,RCC1/PF00415.13/2.3e+03,RCC1/PF00415.13/2.7e-06,RCC1_2/PF13540.1/21,RCC1_2/PF13540.1/6.7,RCC1_2/PF13540.1/1.6e-05 TRINITY_DN14851_c0_g1_i1:30-608(-)
MPPKPCFRFWVAGSNSHGQLGRSKEGEDDHQSIPRIIRSYAVLMISCGGEHSAFIANNMLLFTLGRGSEGQLGTKFPRAYVDSPCCVGSATFVHCSRRSTMFVDIRQDEFMICGGGLGGKQSMPFPRKVVNVSGMLSSFIALTDTGTVFTWGRNGDGQLGVGDCKTCDVTKHFTLHTPGYVTHITWYDARIG